MADANGKNVNSAQSCISAFQIQAFIRPGTVVLPSPFPQLGDVWVDKKDLQTSSEKSMNVELLAVGMKRSDSTTIVRFIRPEHVSAIFLPETTVDCDCEKGIWLLSGFEEKEPLLTRLQNAKELSDNRPSKRVKGLVFVLEGAPIVTQIVFGSSASFSAEFEFLQDPHCGCDSVI
jgi:hypothetical protein